jgi:hypothetical protein
MTINYRLLWEKNYGKIPKGYQIHHKNGNHEDNRIENLELIKEEDHRKIHGHYYKKGQIPFNKNIPFKNIISKEKNEKRKKKISETLKRLFAEGKRKGNNRRGCKQSKETRNKIGKSNKGKVRTEEQKKQRSIIQKNLWKDEDYKEKMLNKRRINAP